MADEEQTPPAGEQDTSEDVQVPEGAQNPDAVKAALQREREAAKAARHEAEGLKARLKEYEDRNKSESEKLAERIAETERQATELAARNLRYEVAAERGLDLKAASFLAGSTREEIEARADELAQMLAAQKQQQTVPSLDGGARPAATPPADPKDAHQSLIAGLLGGQIGQP